MALKLIMADGLTRLVHNISFSKFCIVWTDAKLRNCMIKIDTGSSMELLDPNEIKDIVPD